MWPFSSGLVRTRQVMMSARTGCVIQVLLPEIFQTSPSLTALVRRLARSEPVFGSVNTAVGSVSPEAMPGRKRCFCSSVPPHRMSSAAISERVPSEPTPI